MEKLDNDLIKRLTYNKLQDDTAEIGLLKAKRNILENSANSQVMNDNECLAYFQAIFCTEYLVLSSESQQKSEQNKKDCVSLYKQALQRKPTDEQLRFMFAASFYALSRTQTENYGSQGRWDDSSSLGCMDILQDKEIAQDMNLSKKLIDAMLQWEKSLKDDGADNSVDNKNCNLDTALALMNKNFQINTLMRICVENIIIEEHPSYQRAVYLFEKINKRIEKDVVAAGQAYNYLNENLNHDVMKGAFDSSPKLSEAYANFEQSYANAYISQIQAALNKSQLHKAHKPGEMPSHTKFRISKNMKRE